jgi:hypothetical protein
MRIDSFERKRPNFLAVLLAGAFVGGLIGRALADSGAHLTLAEGDEEQIDTALLGKQPGPAVQSVYISTTATVSNMPYNVFIRNTGLWIGSKVDLTAIGAYNTRSDAYGTKFEITAISPLHCLGSAHVAARPGEMVNFVGSDSKTCTRTVVAALNPVGDIEVYLLNQALPPSVKPMHVLPRDWARYLRPGIELDLPVIFINQQNWLYCAEAAGIQATADPLVVYRAPSTRLRLAFNAQVISGDSSFPQMVLVNGVPAILSLWHFGGFGAGPLVAAHYDAINTAMRQLSQKFSQPVRYQLRPVDMTGIAKQ